MNFQKGFTLIELLVVIAIIGLLVTIFLVDAHNVEQRNRDMQRVSDVRSIKQALMLWESNHNSYPIYNGYLTGSDVVSNNLISEGLISQMPKDPINSASGGADYRYHYSSSSGNDFVIKYYLETDSVLNKSAGENTVKP